jgi:hypothetical protein
MLGNQISAFVFPFRGEHPRGGAHYDPLPVGVHCSRNGKMPLNLDKH